MVKVATAHNKEQTKNKVRNKVPYTKLCGSRKRSDVAKKRKRPESESSG